MDVNCLICGKKIKANPKKKKCPHCHQALEWMVLDDRVHLLSAAMILEKQKEVECFSCGNKVKANIDNKICNNCKSGLTWVDNGNGPILWCCNTLQNESIYYRLQEG